MIKVTHHKSQKMKSSHAHLRDGLQFSEPPSPDYSNSSEDEDDGNVGGQQPQPCQWTLPPKPWRRVVHTFIGAPNRKRDFRLTLIREMLARAGQEPRPSMPVGRPASTSKNIRRLDTSHNKHWPGCDQKKAQCRVCSAGGVRRTVIYRCVKCDVALCVDRNCFEVYHTKTSL